MFHKIKMRRANSNCILRLTIFVWCRVVGHEVDGEKVWENRPLIRSSLCCHILYNIVSSRVDAT